MMSTRADDTPLTSENAVGGIDQNEPAGAGAGTRKALAWSAWAAAGVALVLAMVVLSALYVRFPVTIDGRAESVPLGVTVATLQKQHYLNVHNGRLLAAKSHRILRENGGTRYQITVSGRPAIPTTRVWPWSTVTSRNGIDALESVVTTRVAVPIETTYEGKGPLVFMTQPGSVGLDQQVRGRVSGEVVSSQTLIKETPAVFLRAHPGGSGKLIALTFDDGPWPKSTEAILSVLKQYNVKATFFMLGQQAKRYPLIVKDIAQQGSDLGTHSWDHRDLSKAPVSAISWEIRSAEDQVQKITGQLPRWFRPPYGAVSSAVYGQASDAKVNLVLWDVDPQDWRRPPPAVIADRVVNGSRPGDVVLMHDGGGDRKNTVAALPLVIQRLRALGYQFVTMDQLYASGARKRR